MDAKKKQALVKEFLKHSTQMVDVEHVSQVIEKGMDTHIKEGDYVIGTRHYDSSIFVIDPLYKTRERQETTYVEGEKKTRYWKENGEKLSNPYEELVMDNDPDSRCASLSVIVYNKRDEARGRTEMRVKVKKLCLLSWDEKNNCFPRISHDIIFRQREVHFATEYAELSSYYKRILADRPVWISDERMEEARTYANTLDKLFEIPPFICFWDDKYGFLIKREVRMTPIILSPTVPQNKSVGNHNEVIGAFIGGGMKLVGDQIEQKVKEFEEHMDRREQQEISFKEQLAMETFRPERMEKIIEKHGIDGMEKTFDPACEGVGLPDEKKPKRKLKLVKA